jgi:hypothetical protein
MKLIAIFLSLIIYSAQAESFLIKGQGRSLGESETVARKQAIHNAKNDAKRLARYACWSRQARGHLCGSFMIEVISFDKYYAHEAIATAKGEFICHQDESCTKIE